MPTSDLKFTSIVSYTCKGERQEDEQEFTCLKYAVAFADRIIEDGGIADVSTSEIFDAKEFSYSLCDIHQLTT